MAQEPALNHNSAAVQKHLEMVQGVIARMAENSRACKLWCVTLVSAVLVLVARTEKPDYALIALIPAVLSWSSTPTTWRWSGRSANRMIRSSGRCMKAY